MTTPRLAVWIAAVVALLLLIAYVLFLRRGRLVAEVAIAADGALAEQLRRDVVALTANGPRNLDEPENLAAAARLIEHSLGPRTERQTFFVDGVEVANLILEIPGTSRRGEIVVIGAHYDSVYASPGADDNASGVAALLAIARRFAGSRPARTLRFVAFVNEEPPYFKSEAMGSWHYARRCRQRNENVVAMLSLEMLGYYDARPGSQQYPMPLAAFYPDTANFIGFAGNFRSRALVKRCYRAFRAHTNFPAEHAVLPELIQQVGWSDQWSFWRFGYPGVMVTDTALFRNPHYHSPSDTPETLDYARMAMVVEGLAGVVAELAK